MGLVNTQARRSRATTKPISPQYAKDAKEKQKVDLPQRTRRHTKKIRTNSYRRGRKDSQRYAEQNLRKRRGNLGTESTPAKCVSIHKLHGKTHRGWRCLDVNVCGSQLWSRTLDIRNNNSGVFAATAVDLFIGRSRGQFRRLAGLSLRKLSIVWRRLCSANR